jgi:hypothetical protein
MTDERYTAEAFMKAIGRPECQYLIDGLFDECEGLLADSYALGLALEWLRGKAQYIDVSDKVLYHMAQQRPRHNRDTFNWLLFFCPRPGAALAKAIIDASAER